MITISASQNSITVGFNEPEHNNGRLKLLYDFHFYYFSLSIFINKVKMKKKLLLFVLSNVVSFMSLGNEGAVYII